MIGCHFGWQERYVAEVRNGGVWRLGCWGKLQEGGGAMVVTIKWPVKRITIPHLVRGQSLWWGWWGEKWEVLRGRSTALELPKSEVAQSCPTLCDPTDCSLPGSSIHGIFQARVPEWVAISCSRGSSQHRDRTQVSHIVGRRFYHLSHQGSQIYGRYTKDKEREIKAYHHRKIISSQRQTWREEEDD